MGDSRATLGTLGSSLGVTLGNFGVLWGVLGHSGGTLGYYPISGPHRPAKCCRTTMPVDKIWSPGICQRHPGTRPGQSGAIWGNPGQSGAIRGNPRNPRKWCHDPLLGTSPTRAGGQDDVSSQANSLKLRGGGSNSIRSIFYTACVISP